MQELTNLEKITLDDITKDCFYEDGLDSIIWVDCFLDTSSLDVSILRGVLSSLIKKRIIFPIVKGGNGVIRFTEFGIQTMIELGYK